MPRFVARLQASRSLRLLVLLPSACLFAGAVYLAWLAFSNPLELEVREGSVWLHVLAKRAGVDIYETTQVAFVNMNHGPLDPILKTWVSRCVPVLPGHMVTRFFVFLAPFFLLASAYVISRRHLATALLAAGTLYLALCHISYMVYVGRSDMTAVCFLVVAGALAHRLLTRHRDWSQRSYLATQIGLGAASAVVILTCWRYAPIVGALQVVVLSTQLRDSRRHLRRPHGLVLVLLIRLVVAAKHLAISTFLYLVGVAAILAPLFFFELHGSSRTLYRRFFGFFLGESGWGISGGAKYEIMPDELLRLRYGIMFFCAALILWALYRLRKRPGELIAWLVMLSATWMTVSYGFFKNRGGGGAHYFYAFFVLAWIFILHVFCSGRRRWGALSQLALVGIVALVFPWRDFVTHRKNLLDARTTARAFRAEVERVTHGQPVFGEETHLFKRTYQGELVDTGDTSSAIARSGYFGEAFTQTYDLHLRRLTANPPKFVIGARMAESNPQRLMSGPLQALLKNAYTIRAIAQGSAFVNGASQALFERNY